MCKFIILNKSNFLCVSSIILIEAQILLRSSTTIQYSRDTRSIICMHKNVLDQQHVRDRKKPQYTFHRIAMKTLQTRRLLCLRDVTVDCFRF